jgi:hypothetical protein
MQAEVEVQKLQQNLQREKVQADIAVTDRPRQLRSRRVLTVPAMTSGRKGSSSVRGSCSSQSRRARLAALDPL